jgi:polar amino acid transport system substrate-binding protein
MKKITFLLLFFLLFSNNILSKEPTISVHPSAHPYGWHDKNELKGAVVELVKVIANDLNIKVKPLILPWARSINDVKTGKLDMVLTTFYTKERANDILFTIPYSHMDTSVFVAKGKEFEFNKWEDLIGKQCLTIVGDSQGDKWDNFEKNNLDVTRVVNIKQIFEMLKNHRADFAVFPKISTLREIKDMGYANDIVNLSTPITSQGIYIGISKKSPYAHLLPQINAKIEEYTKNGFFDKLVDKAFDDKINSHTK